MPDKAPPAATDFSAGPAQVDQQMADAKVTDDQLAKSNEPEFTGALKEKKAAEKHAATAPAQVRAEEKETLAGAKVQAATAGATAMTALAGDRKQAGSQVDSGKEKAKSADEAKRAKVTAVLQKVFDTTKKDVEGILSGLDKKVDAAFTKGEKAARDAFTADHKRRMKAYKDKRYSGLRGKARWVKDKFAGLPAEADQIFVAARQGYVTRMQQVISGVADIIGTELDRAKQRIATGRSQLQAEVKGLAPHLRSIGQKAAAEFSGRFDELTEQVDAKGTQLVQTLASKYNEALKAVDTEINAEKEKNKGLVAKAVDAVGGVIKTILQLKDMLMGVLAKAATAVAAIIKDPIGFLGNLVTAVGAGLKQFLANIGEHLKKGLVGWLTGAMAGAGLELPAKFDLRGIVLMIGSLLGLTWASIRGLIIKRGVPEPAMGAVEKSVPLVQKVQAQGLGGMWEEIQDKVGDLKANLFSKISEYLIPTVLMAGITWIISLLNPASAFVRAAKMIIDFVTFIVTQGAQIIEFVNSVLDAIIAIAGGGTGGVPALIEKALARSVPVLIGALAAVLGIGGIAQKVQKFFKALAKPVMKAVGWVAEKIAALGRKLWAQLKKRTKSAKDGLSRRGSPSRTGRHDASESMTPAEKKQVAAAAAQDTHRRLTSGGTPGKAAAILNKAFAAWRKRGVTSLSIRKSGAASFFILAKVNPEHPSPEAIWDPNEKGVAHLLSFKQATAGGKAWASGSIVANNETGMLFGPSKNKPKVAARRDATVHQDAHAEETVIARLKLKWTEIEEEMREKKLAPHDVSVNLEIHVGYSCCVNCATYFADFVEELREAGYPVTATGRFSTFYRGGNTGGNMAKPTRVSDSMIKKRQHLYKLFLGQSMMKPASEGGMLGPSDPGRYWGTGSETQSRSPDGETWHTIRNKREQGLLALAILRAQNITVDVLDREHLSGNMSDEQEAMLADRTTILQEAVAEVDKKLMTAEAGS